MNASLCFFRRKRRLSCPEAAHPSAKIFPPPTEAAGEQIESVESIEVAMSEELLAVAGGIEQRLEDFGMVLGIMECGADEFRHFAFAEEVLPRIDAGFDRAGDGAVAAAPPFQPGSLGFHNFFDEILPSFFQKQKMLAHAYGFTGAPLFQDRLPSAEVDLTAGPVSDGVRDIRFEDHFASSFLLRK